MSGILEDTLARIEERMTKVPVRLTTEQLEQLRDDLRTLQLRTAGPEQRMTADDVCLYLGISRRTLERRVQHGEMPPARAVGGTKMWTKRDLEP